MKKRAWIIIGGAVVAALVYAQLNRGGAESFSRNPNGQALIETYSLIQDQYLKTLDQTQLNKLLEGGIRGMLNALGDEFTSYSPPARAAQRQEDLRGEFFGIGATLAPAQQGGTGAQIQGLIRGLPAFNAGLRVGDQIVEVNGEDVTKLDLEEVVSKIRGPRGTKVTIGVKREGNNAVLRFELIRELVKIIEVNKALLPDNIGYIELRSFANINVSSQLNAAISDLRKQGMQKLIFDLRDNGGGLLDQGCAVAKAFIKEGPIVYTKTRTETRLYCEANGQVQWSGPMVVLVNGNSASASEIVAGALQDTGRAKLVGEKTFGKGVGQNVIDLANGGDLTLVTFQWLTPKKRAITRDQGIQPDVVVRDNRFPVPVSFEGTGAKPGATVTLTVDGKTYTAKADETGKYAFSQPLPARPANDNSGNAMVDPQNDAILARALQELK